MVIVVLPSLFDEGAKREAGETPALPPQL